MKFGYGWILYIYIYIYIYLDTDMAYICLYNTIPHHTYIHTTANMYCRTLKTILQSHQILSALYIKYNQVPTNFNSAGDFDFIAFWHGFPQVMHVLLVWVQVSDCMMCRFWKMEVYCYSKCIELNNSV